MNRDELRLERELNRQGTFPRDILADPTDPGLLKACSRHPSAHQVAGGVVVEAAQTQASEEAEVIPFPSNATDEQQSFDF